MSGLIVPKFPLIGYNGNGKHSNYVGDINAINHNSVYYFETWSVTNEPPISSMSGFIETKMYPWNNNFGVQVVRDMINSETLTRSNGSGVWGPWFKGLNGTHESAADPHPQYLKESAKTWTLIDVDSGVNVTQLLVDGMSADYEEYMLTAFNLTRLGSVGALYCKVRNAGVDVGSQFAFVTLPTTSAGVAGSEIEFKFHLPRTTRSKRVIYHGYDGRDDAIQNFTFADPVYTGVIDGYRFYTPGPGPFTGTVKLYGR